MNEDQLLSPYLPRLVIEWITQEPQVIARALEGTIVFIDISGFTKLSERLARQWLLVLQGLREAGKP